MPTDVITLANSYTTGFGTGANFEHVIITAAGYVVNPHASDGSAIGVNLSGQIVVVSNAGLIDGDIGIQVATGVDDLISIGSTGIVTALIGIMVKSNSTNVINAGLISAIIGIELSSTQNMITNTGTISVTAEGIFDAGFNTIHNLGNVTANTAIYAGADDVIYNAGFLSGKYGLYTGSSSGVHFTNSGTINAAFGAYFGSNGAGGTDTLNNSGQISADSAAITSVLDSITLFNSGSIRSAIGTALSLGGGDDKITNLKSGSISGDVFSGGGADQISNYGVIDGSVVAGAGDDILVNLGSISGSVYMDDGADTLTNRGTIAGGVSMGPGSDLHDNFRNFGTVDLGVIADGYFLNRGVVHNGVTMGAGDDVVQNFGAITDDVVLGNGANTYVGVGGSVTGTIYGGSGVDLFYFNADGITSTTTLDGGSGAAADVLTFLTPGTIAANALANVTGIERINLAAGSNSLTLSDPFVASANAHAVSIAGNSGVDILDASSLTATTEYLHIFGRGGADQILAGSERDYFVYAAASESTGGAYDTITGANFALDHFDTPGAAGTILAINPAVLSGALSTPTYDADLAAAVGPAKLGAHDALLFTASSGTLSGQTFLVVDLNGTAGYQSGADLVVRLIGQTGTLATSNFV